LLQVSTIAPLLACAALLLSSRRHRDNALAIPTRPVGGKQIVSFRRCAAVSKKSPALFLMT
jgi:hypothetical protein